MKVLVPAVLAAFVQLRGQQIGIYGDEVKPMK